MTSDFRHSNKRRNRSMYYVSLFSFQLIKLVGNLVDHYDI